MSRVTFRSTTPDKSKPAGEGGLASDRHFAGSGLCQAPRHSQIPLTDLRALRRLRRVKDGMKLDARGFVVGGAIGLTSNPPVYFGVDFCMRMQVERRLFAAVLVHEF